SGFGADRIVELELSGPTTELVHMWVIARDAPDEGQVVGSFAQYISTSSTIEILLSPAKPIIGTVRDRRTGEPVAGVVVSYGRARRAVTDKDGRYRLPGVVKNDRYYLTVHAQPGAPYFELRFDDRFVLDTPGLEPLTADFELERGIEITGRVTNKASNEPVAGRVLYVPLPDNPHLAEYTTLDRQRMDVSRGATDRQGRFTLVAIPGPGVLVFLPSDKEAQFVTSNAADELGKLGIRHWPAVLVPAIVRIDPSMDQPPAPIEIRVEPVANADAGTVPKKRTDLLVSQPGGEAAQVQPSPAAASATTKAEAVPAAEITVSGTVLTPAGKPLAGATVRAAAPFHSMLKPTVGEDASPEPFEIRTDDRGRFNVLIERARRDAVLEKNPDAKVRFGATAQAYGFAWADIEASALDEDVRLILREDVPVEGRIVTTEGQPAIGVALHVNSIPVEGRDDVDRFIKSARGSSGVYHNSVSLWLMRGGPVVEPVVTDVEGRFRIEGLGRDRVIRLEATGGGIGASRLAVVTRAAPPGEAPNGAIAVKEGLAESVYYTGFTHIAAPGRTLQGIISDAETGDPVAGVRVKTFESWHSLTHPAITEADGRFEISGVPKQDQYRLLVEPTSSLHFNKEVKVVDPPGLEPVKINVSLLRGITVRGRVTDAETGEPLPGSVIYNPLFPNENVLKLGEDLSIANPAASGLIRGDGSYEISVLPGPGVIAAQVSTGGYVSATVNPDRLREIIDEQQVRANEHGEVRFLHTAAGRQAQGVMGLNQHEAIALVHPTDEVGEQTFDLQAVRGRSRQGTIEDDAGQPVVGVKVIGLGASGTTATFQPLERADFIIEGLAPRRKRTLLFVHQGRNLGARVVVSGDEAAPVRVQMSLTGTITGRFVNETEEPLADVEVELSPRDPPLSGTGFWHAESDQNGRFRVRGVIADASYIAPARSRQKRGPALHVQSDIRVESGKTLDLGTFSQANEYQFRRVDEESDKAGGAE
ncbi:MAG TPA: carboxypeptidase regulatory-like domain-containing protein, partial [Planctomycetaceae bacterium]|nr:carboxypeptidase regulatory-like domain-containing protein [Planctomycetaceae bacterium]